MRKFLATILNILFIILVIIISLSIAGIALTKKVDDYLTQYKYSLSGSVVKQAIPVMSYTKGVIEKINVKIGDEVKKGDVLVVLSNPALQGELGALKQFPSNVSAQTQAKVDEQQLKALTITAPDSGIVGDIAVSEKYSVDSFTKLLTLYSNKNIQFLANLTIDQYQAVKHSSKIEAYSPRLGQNFAITPSIVNPNIKQPLNFDQKKISLYFNFNNQDEAISLLNNEDLYLRLTNNTQSYTKPLDFIVNFWNSILHLDQMNQQT